MQNKKMAWLLASVLGSVLAAPTVLADCAEHKEQKKALQEEFQAEHEAMKSEHKAEKEALKTEHKAQKQEMKSHQDDAESAYEEMKEEEQDRIH